jgi:zinc protease
MAIERYRLDNGLVVLVLSDRQAPVLCYQTWFAVGSRHERPGKTGISHLFEHLLFGQTEDLPHGQFDRLLEEAGAESNAATYLDWTYYTISLPRDALELVVRLEADRLHNLVLRDDTVASEREVVANERRQAVEDDVDGAIAERLYEMVFQSHGYRWPTIGYMPDILGLTTEDCQRFYGTYYAPNNATVVVVGDVDPDGLIQLVEQRYGAIGAAEIPVEDVRPEPPQQQERRVALDKPTAADKLVVAYRSPAFGDVDHSPLIVLNEILVGGRASRLHRALVQDPELASSVRAYVGSFRDPSLWDFWLVARRGVSLGELEAKLGDLLTAVREEPVSPDELQRAQARVELSSLQGLETVSGRASQIGFCETVLGDPAALFRKVEEVQRVRRDDLLRVARTYLRDEARTVIEVRREAT